MGLKTFEIESWGEFGDALKCAQDAVSGRGREYGRPDALLYRGHGDAEWALDTTLERSSLGGGDWTTLSYVQRVCSLRPEIEARTGHRFDAPEFQDVQRAIADLEAHEVEDKRWRQPARMRLPAYDYLVYLRQMGFPSPLLDWSRSPYVAAFFAMHRAEGERVALYVYNERPNLAKGWTSWEPRIEVMTHGGRNHARHYLQQAAYTVSAKWTYDKAEWHLRRHEEVIGAANGPKSGSQDRCVRISLPASERSKAMAWLATVNITAETLFQTEEAVIESLTERSWVPVPVLRKPEVEGESGAGSQDLE